MHYVKLKREKIGKCNICTSEKELTWDHVPPQGGIELTAVEINTVFNKFTGQYKDSKLAISQNGLKFRTICGDCNTKILGKKYDPIINDLAIKAGRYLNSGLSLPSVIYLKTKPAALMRGILGHLLAAKPEFEDGGFELRAREAIFNESEPIPKEIFIFYWVYPFTQITVMRDFVMPSRRGIFKNLALFNTLKYFPIAYLISTDPNYENLLELTRYRDYTLDREIEIPIQLNRIESIDWPERVDPGNFLLGGQGMVDSVAAKPRKSFRKNLPRS